MNPLLLLLLAATPLVQTPVEAARAHRDAHGPEILQEFAELLRLPNVAAQLADVRANARWIAAAFAKRGVALQLLELDDAPPLVVGRWEAPGATRTLGVYAHYDGQPVQAEKWTHDPWEPVLYSAAMEQGGELRPWPEAGEEVDPEWRIYGRAAGDDKAPILALLAAIDALRANEIGRTVNVVFLFEGEEEAGSPHLADYLEKYRHRLQVDAWLFCDGPMHTTGRPQLVFGVRGVIGMEFTVYGANRGLHSGHYGNWAPNPALMLAELLAGMKDEQGNVTVDGFYDSVEPLSDRFRQAVAALPNHDDALRHELGLSWTEGGGQSLAERILLPSLNIRGMESGAVGTRARNMIPSTATAALDIRLVPGNDPDAMVDLVEAHIEKQGFQVARQEPTGPIRLRQPRTVWVRRGTGYPAYRSSMDAPLVPLLIGAVTEASGVAPVLNPGLGGSLPLYRFQALGEAPIVIVPIANHDNNQHAPDENLRIANLWYGIDLFAALLTLAPAD